MRFPTSLTGDGTDAMNTDCDYSSAYVSLFTDGSLVGHGMTFTIGRGNEIVSGAFLLHLRLYTVHSSPIPFQLSFALPK